MKNFGFYVSGNSSSCLRFLAQCPSNVLQSIKIVVSDKEVTNTDFLSILNNNNIELKTYIHKQLPGATIKARNLALSNLMMKELKAAKIDYCFSFGSHILSGDLLKEYKERIINFHPAILPMFPGEKAIDQALNHGNVLFVGNTAHFIDEGMDTGPVIMQSIIPLRSMMQSSGIDYNVVLSLQTEMLNKLICLLSNDMIVCNNGIVNILNADYNYSETFPKIN